MTLGKMAAGELTWYPSVSFQLNLEMKLMRT